VVFVFYFHIEENKKTRNVDKMLVMTASVPRLRKDVFSFRESRSDLPEKQNIVALSTC